jgi:hypothetical protein
VTAERAAWRLSTGELSPAEALAPATEALAILAEADDARGQNRAWVTIGSAHNYRCEMTLLGEANARAESFAARIGFSTAASIGGQAAALLYGPTPAGAAITACLELLDRTVDRAGRANVLATLGALHGLLGRFEQAADLLEESGSAYAEIGMTHARHTSWAHGAYWVARLAERPAEAEAIARTSMETLLELREHAWAATRAVQLAELALDGAREREAAGLATLARRHASKHDVLVQFMLLRVAARLKARNGDLVAAERLARRAVAVSERTDDVSARAETLTALAIVLRLAGRARDADAAVAEADALFEAKENVAGRARAHALLDQLQPV